MYYINRSAKGLFVIKYIGSDLGSPSIVGDGCLNAAINQSQEDDKTIVNQKNDKQNKRVNDGLEYICFWDIISIDIIEYNLPMHIKLIY